MLVARVLQFPAYGENFSFDLLYKICYSRLRARFIIDGGANRHITIQNIKLKKPG